MFWDRIAGIYNLFEDVYNGKVNQSVSAAVASFIHSDDIVLECACGTGLLTKAIAPHCKRILATDFSGGMLRQTAKNCAKYPNVTIRKADITALKCKDSRFDKVVAGNVIHLLDDPQAALKELSRVCKPDGTILIPTYINQQNTGSPTLSVRLIGKAGAHFKQQFTFESYQQFIRDAGFPDAAFSMIAGRVPCAIAVIPNQK
ncbi:MAG TPA: SAM-dependent methyltransferase [Ruminococcus sp.]|nr:SAM-dependent methyltransferase [Ruminococcus sp.]